MRSVSTSSAMVRCSIASLMSLSSRFIGAISRSTVACNASCCIRNSLCCSSTSLKSLAVTRASGLPGTSTTVNSCSSQERKTTEPSLIFSTRSGSMTAPMDTALRLPELSLAMTRRSSSVKPSMTNSASQASSTRFREVARPIGSVLLSCLRKTTGFFM